jgi:hypothetical protein
LALKDANKLKQNIELALVFVVATFTAQAGRKILWGEGNNHFHFLVHALCPAFLLAQQDFFFYWAWLPLLLVSNTTYTYNLLTLKSICR